MTKWIALLLVASTCWAQAPAKPTEPQTFYQLTFAVKEVQGDRVVNTRSYYLTAGAQGTCMLRAGEKVPYNTGGGGTLTQYQQVDVGVGIVCGHFEVIGDKLSLRVGATIDSVAAGEQKNAEHPIIRSNRWDATVLVPLRQPTVIFSSDDPFSTQKMQLQLTVTPLR